MVYIDWREGTKEKKVNKIFGEKKSGKKKKIAECGSTQKSSSDIFRKVVSSNSNLRKT